jgi:hypothetical protein
MTKGQKSEGEKNTGKKNGVLSIAKYVSIILFIYERDMSQRGHSINKVLL